ncbi:MAG: glycosyl hydrolase [Motilibacteraceae bacterium]
MTGGLSRRHLLKLGALAPAAIALGGLQVPAAAAATSPALPEVVPSRKKGVGVARMADQAAYRVQSMNPAWYYTWAADGIDDVQDVAFVPMVWGGAKDDRVQTQVDDVRALGPGRRPVVLGFNEPDNGSQSNMSVDRALGWWPEVSHLAALTVAPAPVHPLAPQDTWFTEFFQRATELGLTFNYVAVHNYPGGSMAGRQPVDEAAADLLGTIDRVYQTYGIPIWVTEFALADWGAKKLGIENRYTTADALAFMQAVLPELERRPHVARYAWFGAGPLAATSLPLGPSALFDIDGDMTELGAFYAQFGSTQRAAVSSPVQAGGAARR